MSRLIKRCLSAVAVGLFLFVLAVMPAYAQCDSANQCVPTISGIPATASSFTVGWYNPGVTPDRIEIRQGGTEQKSFQDGALLGSVSPTWAQNVGNVTANNLKANTRYAPLRLCSVFSTYGFVAWCTDEFAAVTSSPSSGSSSGASYLPTNLRAVAVSYNRIDITWTNGTGAALYLQHYEDRHLIYSYPVPPEKLRSKETTVSEGPCANIEPGTTHQYQVLAIGLASGGVPIPEFTGRVQVTTPPLPVPKSPFGVQLFAYSRDLVSITWQQDIGRDPSCVGDKVTQWFEIERQAIPTRVRAGGRSTPVWSTLPRIWATDRRSFKDNPRGALVKEPFTYRVCAGNSSGRNCSDAVQAKAQISIPGRPR